MKSIGQIVKGKEPWIVKVITLVFLGYIAFAICMQSTTNIWYDGDCSGDSAIFRYMAYAASRGQIWYKDVFDHKGPLIFFLNYIGMMISFWRGIWVVEIVFMLGTIFAAYKTARLICNRWMSCCCVLVVATTIFQYFEAGNFTEEYAVTFIMIAIYIFLDYFLNQKINGIRLAVCGFCFGGILLLRPNMGGVWFVFCIAVLIQKIYQKRLLECLKFLGLFLLGCIIFLIPFAVYLIHVDALEEGIYAAFTFNFMYSEDGNLIKTLEYMTNIFKEPIMLASLIAIVYQLTKSPKRGFHIAYLICVIVCVYLAYMSGRGYGHYAMAIIPLYIYPIATLFQLSKEIFSAKNVYFIVLYYFVVVLSLPTWLDATYHIADCYVNRDGRDQSLQTVIDVIQENSTEDEKISVVGNRSIIYLLSKRLSVSKYAHQYPIAMISDEIWNEYLSDLEETPPALIVMVEYEELNKRVEPFIEEYDYELIYENQEQCHKVYKLIR